MGKSFNDIFNAINKRQEKINDLSNPLKGGTLTKDQAKQQVGGLLSYIFKDNSKEKLVEEFETFKSMMTDYGMTAEEVAKDLGDQLSPEIQSYVKSAKNGELTTEGFNKSIGNLSLGAKAASMALEGLKYVGNMLASIALSAVISLAIKGLNNLVHAADNAKKSAEGFSSSFKSMNEEFASNDGKLSDLQKQYNELSKGVDSLGKNVSLTTEDYDTYKQVVSEISDMMPDMLARYDEEGNKIGFVQGKLKNLSAEYDNYKKKRAVDLVNGKNDNGDSVKDVFNNYQYQTAHVNEDSNVVGKRKIFGTSNYEKILSLQAEINNGYDGIFGKHKLTNEDIEKKTALIQKYQSEIDSSVSAIQNAISAIAQSGDVYYQLSDKEQQFLDRYISSLSQSAIDDCTSSILDAEKALIEYDNAIRQINWDAFDRTRDDVEDLINETDFLVELLKDVGITDDDGNMTKEGQAAQALLAQKYQLYLNQAKAYKDEISKINEDLVNDPYDKELLDRKQDLIDKEQEAIKSAMSEKDAIKDLTNDAYTDFIDKLGDAIDKYKELMDTMKDAYDYEKSIREKTEALNALEKQYSAYQGDNSEEGKKNIQQLKDQINTAKDDLKDTEYEKLINDTEKILDQLQSDVKSWIDQRLDDLDNLIQDIIEHSNENASDISQTITSTAENYGYKLSKPLLFSAKNVNYGKFN